MKLQKQKADNERMLFFLTLINENIQDLGGWFGVLTSHSSLSLYSV